MSKIEINNEIVLLRHTVRQARICVVNKLTKKIKLLQKKHGNKTQQEKYKRKANKFITEIHALKTVKEDDISMFGILNEKSLTEILQDQSLSASDHIMVRIVHYKTLYKKIMQFKKKFPNFKTYLIEKRKKTGKLKSKKKTKNVLKQNNLDKQDENIKKQKILVDETIENIQHSSEDDKRNSDLPEVKNISHKRKKSLDTILERNKSAENESEESDMSDDKVLDKQPNMSKICSVSKKATVKRFTELVEEHDSNEDIPTSVENGDSIDTTVMQNKIMDDFFFTKNQEHYKANYVKAFTSDLTKLHKPKYFEPTKIFPSNLANKKYKNDIENDTSENDKSDTKFNKRQRNNESKYKSNVENSSQNKKYLDIKTFMKTGKKEPNKINKDTNKNINTKNTEDTNLHPSWLARKQQQKIMSQGFQGKKTVFNV